MDTLISELLERIPENADWLRALKLFLVFLLASLILGIVVRGVMGKRSDLNHAVSSAMGILFIYGVSILLYSLCPPNLSEKLPQLPFIRFAGQDVHIFQFAGAEFPQICAQVLSLLVLSFLVNLLDTFIPKGKKVWSWYLYRLLTVAMAMVLHIVVNWLLDQYLPNVLTNFAPMILLAILAGLLLLGAAKIVLGVILTVVNPILGAIYAFFFSNIFGKQITKAAFTTGLLCVLVGLLNYAGIDCISIAPATLAGYAPVVAVVLVLWYLLGHVL